MAVGIYDWALIVDHQRREVSLLSYGDPHARLHWLEAQSAAPTTLFALTSARRSNMSREQYGEKISSGSGPAAQRRLLPVNRLSAFRPATAAMSGRHFAG